MTAWSGYFWPGTETLRNRAGIRDASQLETVERLLVTQRAREGCPSGDFDLVHLQAIHHHLFQNIYGWAGQLRTVDMQTERTAFTHCAEIAHDMAEVHARVRDRNYLTGLDEWRFAHEASVIVGRINVIHPFREGNGRTQSEYLRQLGDRAGWTVDLRRIEPDRWMAASRDTANGLYRGMADQIALTLVPAHDREVIEAFERFGAGPDRDGHDRGRGGHER